jgi:6-pyruvoyl-tetrahydropterin synthase related domain
VNESLLWAPLLAIGAAAFGVEIPFFFLGTPSGHDVEFHLYSWLEVLAQWRHGIAFPRWAPLAHFGYGEPRFIFYPPASWTLGGLLSALVPWTIASPVYIWIVLVAAGASMFTLARRWLDRRDATFAAVLYAVNPYHLVIVYWRSAFAELLAASLVPLLLLFVLRAAEDKQPMTVPLGLVLAGSWVTNAPAAVMIHYSLALLIAYLAWRERSVRLLWMAAGAVALSACLVSFYLLPAIYEQKWITIGEAVSQGSRPADNFLFMHTTDADHDAFNRVISWVASVEMTVIAVAAFAAKPWREKNRQVFFALMLWAAVCSILLFPISLVLWKAVPKLQFMQFPWRWLLCMSLIFTILVSVGLRNWWKRSLVCCLTVLVIVVAWHRVQSPWWDDGADLREMQDNMYTGAGYEGTDEYTPQGADPTAVDKDARKVRVDGPARGAIHISRWDPEFKEFTADLSAADRLALRLFPYPAWRVDVNGRMVQTSAHPGSGQMLVPVVAGMNRVQVTFVRTWDRTLGGWISLISLSALALWSYRKRSNRQVSV